MHRRCIVDVGDAPATSTCSQSGSTSSRTDDPICSDPICSGPPTPSARTPSGRPRLGEPELQRTR
eukprot:6339839-Pyramimonas_sp.AAC.1